MKSRSNLLIKAVLIIIIVAAAFLRTYRLGEVPPAISWDEASVGYNAFTIANWGRDEWGNTMPLVFKSFGDDKNPVHFYFTAITVKLFGLSEFSTRLSSVIFGLFNIILVYLLANLLFKKQLAGILAAILMALSPYAIQFSRFNHELNFALCFFMLGFYLFLVAVKDRPKLLPLAFLSFGVSIFTYHSAKIVVPPMVALLVLLYIKDLIKIKKMFVIACLVLGAVLSLAIFNPGLLGFARFQQASIKEDEIVNTQTYLKTKNKMLGSLEIMYKHYIVHFLPEYLFISGDPIPRHSSQVIGHFYKIEAIFIIVGLLALIIKPSKITLLLVAWTLLAPIPVAPTGGADDKGHAGRAMFLLGSFNLISAYGFYQLILFARKKIFQIPIALVCLGFIAYQLYGYQVYYYSEYVKRYAIEWQYGMREIANYVKDHNGYFRVYMTDARSQPYIFFLYYLQTPLPEFLKTVEYNTSQSRPSSLVASFDRYQFNYWDPIESKPEPGLLYAVTPSQYDGLRHRDTFSVKKRIYYPNGTDAYFIVSYP